MAHKILKLPAVKTRTGLSRSTIYKFVRTDRFPKPIQIGPRSVGWIEAEIEEWVDSRIAASRGLAEVDSPIRSGQTRRYALGHDGRPHRF